MRKIWIVAALAACAIALAGCKVVSEQEPEPVVVKPEPIAVESVTLDATTLTLASGTTGKLTATVNPDNADDKSVKWSSSDTAVAMVDSAGNVVAIKTGTAAITAQAGEKTAICVVIVNEATVVNPDSPIVNPDSPVAVESVTLNAPTLTIEPGKTRTLTATVMPSNANDKTVSWSSSDTEVATVDDSGTVTAIKEGTATITAQVGGRTAECVVTVKPILNPVENVTLNETTLTITRGKTYRLTATVLPENADDRTVAWSAINSEIATVDNDGWITAHNEGSTYITAQAGDIVEWCYVTVNPIPVESVTLDKDTLVLMYGETGKLTAKVTPDDADCYIGFSTEPFYDPVVKVDDDGTVTAVRVGTAIVKAHAGSFTATCTVTVNPAPINVESVTLNATTLTLAPGATRNLTAYVTPYNADDTTVTWSSSDPSVATVDTNNTGVLGSGYSYVTAVSEGTATITAQSGGKKATCEVTVLQEFVIENGILSKYNGLKSTVTIPANVTQIGNEAFKGCTNLTTVNIPKGVTSIGDNAFEGCTNITTVNIPASMMSIASNAFYKCDNIKTVNYDGTLTQWCSMKNSYNLIGKAISVKLSDGKDLKTLTKLEIPEGVTIIEECAFYGCTALENVIIPDSVTDIHSSAFESCERLKTVKISKNVSKIESKVFLWCRSLESVTIPDGVTSIEEYAFYYCDALTDVSIPTSVKKIGEMAFIGCKSLKNVTIPDGVESIELGTFQECSKLINVTIPASVRKIHLLSFNGCSGSIVVNYGGTKSQWESLDFNKYFPSGTTIHDKNGTTWSVVRL